MAQMSLWHVIMRPSNRILDVVARLEKSGINNNVIMQFLKRSRCKNNCKHLDL